MSFKSWKKRYNHFMLWRKLVWKSAENYDDNVAFPTRVLYALRGFSAHEYVCFDLKNNDYRDYISNYTRTLSRELNGEYKLILDNKVLFEDFFKHYVRVPASYAWIHDRHIYARNGYDVNEDNIVDFLKQVGTAVLKIEKGAGGRGVHVISTSDDGLRIDGEPASDEKVRELIASQKQAFICEYMRQWDFGASLYPDSANTIRMICAKKKGEKEARVIAAAQRIGNHDSGMVDNVSSGALAAVIDVETGVLSTGAAPKSHDKDIVMVRYDTHPDTGAQIRGRQIPGWDEIKREITELTNRFPYFNLIAWDVLPTNDGISVIEANASSGVVMFQAERGLRGSELWEVYRSYGYSIITSVSGQVFATLLKFVVRTVFIRTLGKTYLGINGLFSDILTMLSLTELGFDTAINFKLYRPLAEKDEKRVRVLIKFYKTVYRIVGTVILLLGVCLIPLLPHLIKDYDSMSTLGVNLAVVFMLHVMRSVSSYWFFAYRSSIMTANQKKYVLDIANYFIELFTSITKILVLVYVGDFLIYTGTVIFSNILRNFVYATIATRYYPQYFEREEDSLSRDEVVDMLRSCGALFIYKLNSVVMKATDNTVISKFIGLDAVGVYSNYLLFYTTVKSLFDKVYFSVKASMGNLFVTESLEKRYQFFQIMNYISVILFGTSAIGISLCADELITVWVGPDYLIAKPFALLVGVEVFFHGLKMNLGQIRNVSGVFQQMWYRPLIGIVINLGVSIWLVQYYGIHGVIIGTITADLLANFFVDPFVIHKYSFDNYKPASEYYKKNLIYFLVLIAVGVVDYFICGRLFVGHGWWSVIVHALIIGVSVPTTLVLLFWRTQECRYLWNMAGRIIRKVGGKNKK